MKVLAFDAASRTGVAVGSAGNSPRAFSVDLSVQREPGKAPWERRFSRLMRLTQKMIAEHKPDLVVVEEVVQGGRKAQWQLLGLVACIQGQADLMGVPVKAYWPASIRSHFLGRGKKTKTPIKAQVFAKCQMLGWDVPDLDAADAMALWDYAMALESRAHQMSSVGGLFR